MKTVRFWEQIMSSDKYPSIFSSFEHHSKSHQQKAEHERPWGRPYRYGHIAQICMATFWVTCFSSFFTVCVFTCFCHGAKFRKRVFGSLLGVVVMFHKLFFNTDFVVWSRTVGSFQAHFTFLPRVVWQARVAFQAHTKARHCKAKRKDDFSSHIVSSSNWPTGN